MSTVFVAIPTLERPQLARQAIESVLAQSTADFSLLVSDNCSSPAARAELEEYIHELQDPRITFRRQAFNVGEYGQGRLFYREALRAGSEYLLILHDDDLLHPGYLARALQQLREQPGASFFCANFDTIDGDGNSDAETTRQQLDFYGRSGRSSGILRVRDGVLVQNFYAISGTCFRTDALQRSGFVDGDCYGLYPFELNVFLCLADIDASACFCSESLLSLRFHAGSMRRYLDIFGNIEVLQALVLLFERRSYQGVYERRRRRFLGRLHRDCSRYHLRCGELQQARQSLSKALAYAPLSPRNLLLAPGLWLAPALLRRCAGEPAPQYLPGEVADFRRDPVLL